MIIMYPPPNTVLAQQWFQRKWNQLHTLYKFLTQSILVDIQPERIAPKLAMTVESNIILPLKLADDLLSSQLHHDASTHAELYCFWDSVYE